MSPRPIRCPRTIERDTGGEREATFFYVLHTEKKAEAGQLLNLANLEGGGQFLSVFEGPLLRTRDLGNDYSFGGVFVTLLGDRRDLLVFFAGQREVPQNRAGYVGVFPDKTKKDLYICVTDMRS